jgi:microcystin synthetase protein McyB
VDFSISFPEDPGQAIPPEAVDDYLQQELGLPFDLEHPPLLRVRLVKITTGKYLFLFTLHHIVCDGWSLGVIIDEILSYYKAIKEGRKPSLQPPPVQYKDYAVWYNGLSGEYANLHRNYWAQQLSRKIAPIQLPTDKGFSERKTFSGMVTGVHLSREASQYLRKLIVQYDASLFVIMVSAINILLFKYSSQTEITVGAPVAGRFHPDLEKQVGLFLNYLVLKSRIERDETYQDYLHSLKQSVFEAYSHQVYPYDKLVEQYYPPPTEEGRNPFYDVLVVMNNEDLNGSKENLQVLETLMGAQKISLNGITSKCALTFFITDAPEIGINLEYSDELFRTRTAMDILQRLCLLLKLLPSNQFTTIREISRLLSDQAEDFSVRELAEQNSRVINEDF